MRALLIIIALVFASAESFSTTMTVEFIKGSWGQYNRWWNEVWDPGSGESPCPTTGTTCKVKITNGVQIVTPTEQVGYGWTANVPIGNLDFEHVNGVDVETASSPGITFINNDYLLRIVSWPGNSSYEGITISMANLTVASNKTVNVFIPY